MNRKGSGSWKEFFTLSRRDRLGLLTLALLTFGSLLLPRFISPAGGRMPAVEAARLDSLVGSREPGAESREWDVAGRERAAGKAATVYERPSAPFDPNTLSEEGWVALGLPQRKARTIRKYLEKGGRFRRAADLMKIYGMPPRFYEAVSEMVVIEQKEDREQSGARSREWRVQRGERPPPAVVDLNSADSAALEGLPGIGPTLARRILLFRERLGGFTSLDQLREVWGLQDSARRTLLPRLRVAPGSWQTLPINSATREELDRHPYLRGAPARLIAAWRVQHGPLLHPSDLQRAAGLSDSLLLRLEPYISYRQ